MSAATLTRLALPLDANWRLRGHCVTRPVDPDVMYPDHDAEDRARAKRQCGGCPVQRECFIDSIDQRDFEGVRAGMTGGERKAWFDEHHPDGKRLSAERAGRGKTTPMGCARCQVPRLQHAAKDHSYRPPAMRTVLARAAALKNGSKAA
ncbi:WhiB family transcriptional regulator [Micromonospora chokoriensis]|uniref:WhiB family transcriptional regulator n=1 Tax=Micromonospora chokoriensis TaxID=356851 RepID=UPI000690B47D|nr:WhiB family transcriptional regulator [Micromonospora chokoriensis]